MKMLLEMFIFILTLHISMSSREVREKLSKNYTGIGPVSMENYFLFGNLDLQL